VPRRPLLQTIAPPLYASAFAASNHQRDRCRQSRAAPPLSVQKRSAATTRCKRQDAVRQTGAFSPVDECFITLTTVRERLGLVGESGSVNRTLTMERFWVLSPCNRQHHTRRHCGSIAPPKPNLSAPQACRCVQTRSVAFQPAPPGRPADHRTFPPCCQAPPSGSARNDAIADAFDRRGPCPR